MITCKRCHWRIPLRRMDRDAATWVLIQHYQERHPRWWALHNRYHLPAWIVGAA